MKRIFQSTVSFILAFIFIFALVSCNTTEKTALWEKATYQEDREFGSGTKTVVVQVKAEEKQVTFTIKTDKDTVGAALMEYNLLAGEEGQFGLYVKVVNGMTADFDVDQTYWAFYTNGDYALAGVDSTQIQEGVIYQLVHTKG